MKSLDLSHMPKLFRKTICLPLLSILILGCTGKSGFSTSSSGAISAVTNALVSTSALSASTTVALPLGTVSSSGTTVTGVGSNFTSSLKVGDSIVSAGLSGGQYVWSSQTVTAIASDTSLTTAAAFSPALSAALYFRVGAIVNGNLGVGTSVPTSNLQVNPQASGASYSSLTVGDNASSLSDKNSYSVTTYSDGNVYLDAKSSSSGGKVYYRTGVGAQHSAATTYMEVDSATGNIGMGAPPAGYPGARLELRTTLDSGLAANIGGSSPAYPRLQIFGDQGAGVGTLISFNTGNGGTIATTLGSGSPIRINPQGWPGGNGNLGIMVNYSGNVGIDNPNPQYALDVGGVARATMVVYNSDSRLKENIKEIPSALKKIDALKGVTFDWNSLAKQRGEKNNSEQLGLIAQDVERIFPQAVQTAPDGYKSVNYPILIAPLVQAVKELKVQNELLEKRLQALEQKMGSR